MSDDSEHNVYFDKLIQSLEKKRSKPSKSHLELDNDLDDDPVIPIDKLTKKYLHRGRDEDDIDHNYFAQNGKYYDPKVYILNPDSGQFVLRSGKIGRKLIHGDNPPPSTRRGGKQSGGSINHRVYTIKKLKKSQEIAEDYEPFYNRASSTSVKIRKLKRGEEKELEKETRNQYEDNKLFKHSSDKYSERLTDRDRDRDRKGEHSRSRERLSDRDRDRKGEHSRSRERLSDRDRDRKGEHSRERGREHSREREHKHSHVPHHSRSSQQKLREELERSKAVRKMEVAKKKEIDEAKGFLYIYTDGSVSNNKRGHKNARGGVGVYFGDKNDPRNISEAFRQGAITNQRAEIWACVRALEVVRDKIDLDETKVVIYSDSMYAINILTRQWKAKDNLDIIKTAWSLMQPGVVFKHIRAHTGKKDKHSVGNAWADRLANQGKEMS
jgi:ribonuclease HI